MSDTRMFKRSQRPTWSCTECARRKIKCDKQIPCQPCTKRGTSHLCSLDHEAISVPRHQNGASGSTSGTNASLESSADFLKAPVTNEDMLFAFRHMQETMSELQERLRFVERKQEAATDINARDIRLSHDTKSDIQQLQGRATQATTVASSTLSLAPSSSKQQARVHSPTMIRQSAEGVADTALTFEYLALGRDRNRDITQDGPGKEKGQPLATTKNILATPLPQPIPASIGQALLPDNKILEYILTYAKDVITWQHACVHVPTFQRECDAFLSLQPHERWVWTDPLWLAMFFVVQSIAVHQMPPNDIRKMFGTCEAPATLLQAAVSCLDAGNFLSEPSLYTCQALAILCVTGHNVADSNLLSSYLAIGIKTAQMLNLHTLGRESERVQMQAEENGGVIQNNSSAWRARIVQLEMGKRIWWSLVQQDYFAMPFCGTSMVHPHQHDTPFPVNAHDEELDQGIFRSHYDDSDLTLVQKLRLTAKAAQKVYQFFENLPRREPARLEEHVQPYEADLLALLPNTQPRSSNPSLKFGLALRRYINISVSHKILVLHRAFCSHQVIHFSDPLSSSQLHLSQARCLDAARQVLDQVRDIKPSGRPEGQIGSVWTISYQAVAAAIVVTLTYFKSNANQAAMIGCQVARAEIYEARNVLKGLSARSSIAARGLALLDNLVHGYDVAERRNSVSFIPKEDLPNDEATWTHQPLGSKRSADSHDPDKQNDETESPKRRRRFVSFLYVVFIIDTLTLVLDQKQTRQVACMASNSPSSLTLTWSGMSVASFSPSLMCLDYLMGVWVIFLGKSFIEDKQMY